MRILPVLAVLILIPVSSVFAQDHHSAMNKRGQKVMGFDQEATTHHFLLFADGGAIDVGVKSTGDTTNMTAIRSHLPHIAKMFQEGNFEAPMLVHDSKSVPGIAVMSARKGSIRYEYVETKAGGRVNITTTDPEALAAVHAFLRFQITDHKTGDPTTVRPR